MQSRRIIKILGYTLFRWPFFLCVEFAWDQWHTNVLPELQDESAWPQPSLTPGYTALCASGKRTWHQKECHYVELDLLIIMCLT